MKAVSAIRAARHGLPKNAMTTTPYRVDQRGHAVWVSVISANEAGSHVCLMRDDGRTFLVDRGHPIFSVKQ